MNSGTSQRILLVIPTYNERENLPRLVERIPPAPATDLLFVDDRSSDGTAEWIRELQVRRPGTHLLERPGKMGLGTAYVAGFAWALERGYDLVFEMDADLSHDPSEIPNFVRRANNGADLVVGSRYLDGIRIINWPLRRLFLSRFASAYTRFWTGLPLTDPTSGFKCFRREALAALDLSRIRSNGYAFQIEVSYYLWKKGFHLAEVPIVFTDRHQGVSKMDPRIVREAAFLVPMLRWRS
ncbi:MAG: polyprenol monophosphomannose synthase [Verrucomicrobiae bacterium]|nr:polyprenol monophosphomannose synthase [Verrucomicrobiae bacterium]